MADAGCPTANAMNRATMPVEAVWTGNQLSFFPTDRRNTARTQASACVCVCVLGTWEIRDTWARSAQHQAKAKRAKPRERERECVCASIGVLELSVKQDWIGLNYRGKPDRLAWLKHHHRPTLCILYIYIYISLCLLAEPGLSWQLCNRLLTIKVVPNALCDFEQNAILWCLFDFILVGSIKI